MPDIATLGLAVDSSKVVAAKKALDDLTASAKPKQRNVRTTPEPETEAILDESFDELEQADAEFSHWRWPMRNDAESGAER